MLDPSCPAVEECLEADRAEGDTGLELFAGSLHFYYREGPLLDLGCNKKMN